jgi:hypothetical protein
MATAELWKAALLLWYVHQCGTPEQSRSTCLSFSIGLFCEVNQHFTLLGYADHTWNQPVLQCRIQIRSRRRQKKDHERGNGAWSRCVHVERVQECSGARLACPGVATCVHVEIAQEWPRVSTLRLSRSGHVCSC